MKLSSKSILATFSLFLIVSSGVREQERTESSMQADAMPPEARYLILFRRLAGPSSRNETSATSQSQTGFPARNQSNDSSPQRTPQPNYPAMLQRNAQLSDDEARALNQIAVDCLQKVKEFDQQANRIIVPRRAQNRAENSGAPGPRTPPPAELSELQHERDNAIRNAIEQIRVAFGDAEFKRFDDYVMNEGSGKRFVLPPADKKALPIQITITLADRNSATLKKQFGAHETFIVQVAMLNNSSQMIAVKPSEIYQWLELTLIQQGRSPNLLLRMGGNNSEDERAVDVPPTQLTVAAQIEFGPSGFVLKPGSYQLMLIAHHKVLLNRPPNNSEWLQLSLSNLEPITFEILPVNKN